MSLGLRRSMSLSEARVKATEIRARLSEGINPTPIRATRRHAKTQQSSLKTGPTSKTFAEVMDLWLKYREENNYWVNDRKEPYATSNLLARHVLPRLGDIDINVITVEDIRDVLVPIWTTKTITAKKALRNIRAILNWARAMNYSFRAAIRTTSFGARTPRTSFADSASSCSNARIYRKPSARFSVRLPAKGSH